MACSWARLLLTLSEMTSAFSKKLHQLADQGKESQKLFLNTIYLLVKSIIFEGNGRKTSPQQHSVDAPTEMTKWQTGCTCKHFTTKRQRPMPLTVWLKEHINWLSDQQTQDKRHFLNLRLHRHHYLTRTTRAKSEAGQKAKRFLQV